MPEAMGQTALMCTAVEEAEVGWPALENDVDTREEFTVAATAHRR